RDWSSDVCSSDLFVPAARRRGPDGRCPRAGGRTAWPCAVAVIAILNGALMTTATLVTDSLATLPPSRLSAWAPRRLARRAAGALRLASKWPFSASGPRTGHPAALAPSPAMSRPAGGVAPAPAARPAAGAFWVHGAGVRSLDARGQQAAHSPSQETPAYAASSGDPFRQPLMAVLLVAIWAALKPGVARHGAPGGFRGADAPSPLPAEPRPPGWPRTPPAA